RPIATGAWEGPVALNPGADPNSSYDVHLAVNGEGAAVAAWQTNFSGRGSGIEAAIRPAGGTWQAPAELSAAADIQQFPRVAIDAAGNAVAVWQRVGGVQSAYRP